MTPAQLRRLKEGFTEVRYRLPRIAGSKAVGFFKGNFRRRGFPMNGVLRKWPQREQPDYRPGGALLVKSGRLRRSIKITLQTQQKVAVGTNVPYAQAHNEGADITGQVFVPAFRRKQHKRKVNGKTQNVAASTVKGHNRKMNTHLPQRRFMGPSPDLMKSIEREYAKELDKIVRQIY